MELPEGFEWVQRDALRVRCLTCGDVISADVLDLHARFDCPGEGASA